ncbi:phosphoribosyl-AMP cyclohydrolase [Cellulomonas sp.]|uniref:phosphoribosyl-AMP cyclohydrolase n=1 Tax=Cellulomonas sp. TaxID=40001 RepID=UPI0028126C6C|nr:phosphoribosyl-AMP cyclohydrolase [Cellulomonas sp.]
MPVDVSPTTPSPRPSGLDPAIAARLRRDASGLVAAIVQQHDTRDVLMLGWMDDEALHRTLTTGRVTFWSRSRQEYWRKGDTSGHVQHVRSVALDCDGDALLVTVDQVGAACHTGTRTCFEAGGPLPVTVPTEADAQAPAEPERGDTP